MKIKGKVNLKDKFRANNLQCTYIAKLINLVLWQIKILNLNYRHNSIQNYQIMNSPNRRKVCQIQIQKQAYQRHINRLQQLREGCSPSQLRRNRQQKKLVNTINAMRKMHAYNRQFRMKEMRQIQQQSKQIDFNKVKSVVTNDFNWPIPVIAPKHKRNQRPIYYQNIKIFERIIHTKSNVNTKNQEYTQRKNKQLPYLSPTDFSKFYQTSRLNMKNGKFIKIRLGKGKRYRKVQLYFNLQEIFDFIKDLQAMYLFQIQYGQSKTRSQGFILGQLEITRVFLKIPQKNFQSSRITVKIIRILDIHQKKQIVKANLLGNIEKRISQNNKEMQVKQNMSYNTYSSSHTPHESELNSKVNQTALISNLQKIDKKFIVKLKLIKQNKFSLYVRQNRTQKQKTIHLLQRETKNVSRIL